MGVGTFRRIVPILYPLFTISPTVDIGHAHNHLLQTALDLGILGLIGYLAVWITAFYMLYQIWVSATQYWYRAIALACLSSLVAYFVYGMFDTVALGAKPAFLFWMLLGLVAGLHQLATRQNPDLIHLSQ
jgi:O-antigen ligase